LSGVSKPQVRNMDLGKKGMEKEINRESEKENKGKEKE
jgi:hypothetical protein